MGIVDSSGAPAPLDPAGRRATARRLVEHLRSGVPVPPTDPPLTSGRARLVARAADMLDVVAQKGSRTLTLQANYGDGKTHALRTIWHLAAERGFVVSNVALTRETPFDRLDRVYPKIVAETYIPGSRQPGLDRLLQPLTPGSEAAQAALRFAEDHLHPKLHAVLRNLVDGSSTEAVERLVQDICRIDLDIADLKRIHRANFGQPLKIERFSAQRDVRDYFRLVDFLVSAAGYSGWVILFDEAELIGRLGRGARAKAYANIGRLAADGLGCRRLLGVFAVASNFYDSVLERKHDAAQAAEWLQARGDADGAERCRDGLAALHEAVLLEPLSAANWGQMVQQLLDAHEAAYGWSAGLSAEAFWRQVEALAPETDTRVRTRLRVAIQWLDLVMQHGHPPAVRVSGPSEPALEWEADDGGSAAEAAAGRGG